MQAVVLPGADVARLAVSPEPPGMWTPGQRYISINSFTLEKLFLLYSKKRVLLNQWFSPFLLK